jgi:hypothetical protein
MDVDVKGRGGLAEETANACRVGVCVCVCVGSGRRAAGDDERGCPGRLLSPVCLTVWTMAQR